jgi:protein SCO1/2
VKRRSVLWLSLVVLSLLAASADAEMTLKAGVFSPPREAPNFSLRGSDGSEITLSQFRGHVVLLVFGFTNCPAVCPTTLATLAEVRQNLGAVAEQLQVIFVTVDPERDNPETMRNFLAAFDHSFIGATGTPDQLASVRTNYGVTVTKVKTGADYGIDHSSSVYLIDAAGNLRGMMPFGRPADDYVHDVKLLIGE